MSEIEIGGIVTDVIQRDPLIMKVKCVSDEKNEIIVVHCQFPLYIFSHDCIYAICEKTIAYFDNHYNTLGISDNATQEEIKKAYKKKAIMYHPDKNEGLEDKFKECLTAYEILSDEKEKRKYDREYEKKCKDEMYHIVKHPFVMIAKDKNSICISFVRILKISFRDACIFFNSVCNYVNDEDKVYDHITDLAERWHDVHDSSILGMFGSDEYNVEKLLDEWYEDYNLRQLQLLGLTKKEIHEMDLPTDVIYNKCISNPYTVYSISINKADEILERMNKEPEPQERQRGVIIRTLWENTEKKKYMCTTTRKLCSLHNVKPHVDTLKKEYNLVVDTIGTGMVYLARYHKIETYIANYVVNAVKTPLDIKYNNIEHVRDTLSADQVQAIHGSLSHKLSIITAAAGCGKSTIIAELVHNLELHNIKYALTSFTGKAVCKIREVTKKDTAKTMHRFVSEAKRIRKNDDINKFEVAVIDEISMVTLDLLYQFLVAHPTIKQLICIGDINQLQPIDAGCFLYEVIKAKVVPTYYLTTNHRVVKGVENEGIILNSNAIISHNPEYSFEFTITDNFEVIDGDISLLMELVKVYYNAGFKDKMTIITPYNNWVREINKRCQELLFSDEPFVVDSIRKSKWFLNDKIMLIKNIQSINVFNGQQGKVTGISETCINVVFDDTGDKVHQFVLDPKNKRVINDDDEEDDNDKELSILKLQHAYATTIMKSQGSESDFVFGFFPEGEKGNNTCFLNKTSAYTLITRSKLRCTLIASKQLLSDIVRRSPAWRCEGLALRLSKELPVIKPNIVYDDEDDDCYEYTKEDYEEYY